MDCLDPSDVKDAECIRAMILPDNVSDDDSIDDRTECDDERYVETREGGAECTGDATSDDDCCSEVDATDNCFRWKGQDEVEQGQTFHAYSSQMEKHSDKIA
jgi:hypothetical protein